jgi:hypothetical protein
VRLGFGTDLLGIAHGEQSREFRPRSEVERPHEVIASATRINAEILGRDHLGVIRAGAVAAIFQYRAVARLGFVLYVLALLIAVPLARHLDRAEIKSVDEGRAPA